MTILLFKLCAYACCPLALAKLCTFDGWGSILSEKINVWSPSNAIPTFFQLTQPILNNENHMGRGYPSYH